MFVDFMIGKWHLQQNLSSRAITASLDIVSTQFQSMHGNTVKHGEIQMFSMFFLFFFHGFFHGFSSQGQSADLSSCAAHIDFLRQTFHVPTCWPVRCQTQSWPIGMHSSSFPIGFKAQQLFLWHQMEVLENRATPNPMFSYVLICFILFYHYFRGIWCICHLILQPGWLLRVHRGEDVQERNSDLELYVVIPWVPWGPSGKAFQGGWKHINSMRIHRDLPPNHSVDGDQKLRPARKMCIIVDDVHLGSFGTKEQLRQVQPLRSWMLAGVESVHDTLCSEYVVAMPLESQLEVLVYQQYQITINQYLWDIVVECCRYWNSTCIILRLR